MTTRTTAGITTALLAAGLACSATTGANAQSYHRLSNLFTGAAKCVDIINNGANNPVTNVNCGQYTGQAWYTTAVPGHPGYYTLKNAFDGPNKCLDIVNDGADNTLIMNFCGNYSGQYWSVTAFGMNSVVQFNKLRTLFTGPSKCLDIVNNGTDNTLIMNPCGNFYGQFWMVLPF